MNKHDKILQNNRIPGSEKLTRPEEISILSKYLGEMRDYMDRNTTLDDTLDDIPGKTTGRFYEVKELPEDVDKIEMGNQPNIDRLDRTLVEGLENKNPELTSLPNFKLDIEQKELDRLDDTRINLDVNQESKLEDKRIDIVVPDDINLDDTRIDLSIDDVELNPKRIDLVVDKDPELSDTRIDLKIDEDVKLDNTRLDIHNNNQPEILPDSVISLVDDREIKLSDTKETITTTEVTELPDYVLSIDVPKDNSLEDFIDSIDVPKDNKLEDTRIDIKDDTDDELEDEIIKRPDSTKSNFWDPEKEGNELHDEYIERLANENPEVDELSNFIDSLDNNRGIPRLEDYVDKLKKPQDVDLEDELKIVPDSEKTNYWDSTKDDNELPDYALIRPDSEKSNFWNPMEDGNELYDSALSRPDCVNDEAVHESLIGLEKKDGSVITDSPFFTERESLLECRNEEDVHNALINLEEGKDKAITDSPYFTERENLPECRNEEDVHKSLLDLLLQEHASLTDDEFFKRIMQVINEGPKSRTTEDAERENKKRLGRLRSGETELGYYSDESWRRKIGTYIPPYLSKDGISEDAAAHYESLLAKSLLLTKNPEDNIPRIPDYKMGEAGNTGFLGKFNKMNGNNYLRYLAEKTVPHKIKGTLRRLLLEETLTALVIARDQAERLTKTNRDRLPGGRGFLGSKVLTNLVQGGVKGAIKGELDSAKDLLGEILVGSTLSHKNPINRPEKETYSVKSRIKEANSSGNYEYQYQGGIGYSVYEVGNNRPSGLSNTSSNNGPTRNILKKLGNKLKEDLGATPRPDTKTFYDTYFNFPAVTTTLSDLCEGSSSLTKSSSLSELFDLLKASPYITTPTKFGTVEKGLYNSMSLDVNGYWEVCITPFASADKRTGNGGFSYLPSIHEMNVINMVDHGVNTGYSRWIPVNSFDLNRSRYESKSISLYNGSVEYPSGVTFSNELRLSIVDDTYKTWRRYFEKCSEVAVYNSEPHWYTYYLDDYTDKDSKNWNTEGGTNYLDSAEKMERKVEINRPTAIDKEHFCVAYYKNITFNIKIYILTPQYGTIKKYDLLAVLNGFQEQYTGDSDISAGQDLSLSFSIVGENPVNGFAGLDNTAINNVQAVQSLTEAARYSNKRRIDAVKRDSKKKGLIKLIGR